MIEYLRAGWDLGHDIHFYIEAVHRLSDLGAVVTHAGRGTSHEGFDAEWREVMLFTVDGDIVQPLRGIRRGDLDAALARFEELSHRRRGWKTRQAEWISAFRRASPPTTGTRWPRCCPTTFPLKIGVES